MNPHLDDADQCTVILVWSGVHAIRAGPPNDEALPGHRLYARGLEKVLWGGVVRHSELIFELEGRNRVHPRHDPARFNELTHVVVRAKERVVEVVARATTVLRLPGPTREAAVWALAETRLEQ